MKTQKEHQSADAPNILKEYNTGGKATITDNRLATERQRELREAMHNSPRVAQQREMQQLMHNSPRVAQQREKLKMIHNSPLQAYAPLRAAMNTQGASQANPIQQKVPKGSSRFQQIAMAMGKKYGVDTSGLEATHNSSFPAGLNAEATIQAHKIHFAPGRDTDYNIRHEVAHAIDNKLHGTPKGNRIVNGQRIDTTREQVVDRMAKEPVTQRNSMSPSIQTETHSFYPDVYQLLALDTDINFNKLNVIGETHSESNRRRRDERTFARSIFGGTGKTIPYWGEGQMGIKKNRKPVIGDNPLLSFQYTLFSALYDLEHNEMNNLDTSLNKLGRTFDENIKAYLRPRDYGRRNWDIEERFLDNLMDVWQEIVDAEKDYDEEEKDFEIPENLKIKFRTAINGYLTNQNLIGEGSENEDINLNVDRPNSQRTLIALRNYLGFRRSEHMLDFVIDWDKDQRGGGIWKVGEQHITDMQQIENNEDLTDRENYTLISRDRFNELLQAWRANRT